MDRYSLGGKRGDEEQWKRRRQSWVEDGRNVERMEILVRVEKEKDGNFLN